MALTPEQLLGVLPSLAGPNGFHIDGNTAVILHGGGRILISVESLPARVLGNLTIPVARVQIGFDGLPEVEQHAFCRRFDRVLQRGGG
jgi:hypothetical protein